MNPKNAMLATTLFLVNLSYGQITNPSIGPITIPATVKSGMMFPFVK
jgi:hypothetical protein